MDLNRRRFLGLAGGVVGAAAVGGVAWEALLRERLEDAAGPGGTLGPAGSTPGSVPAPGPGAGRRVLVVIQLSGGNDGLNTLVPVTDGRYHDARPGLGVAEGEAVALAGQDRYGLHPSLRPLAARWEAGQLAAVDGIGLQGQTRSHFAAMDTWWSAQPGQARVTGWLGRWLDRTGDPTDPLRAIALGTGSPALIGDRATATVVLDPAAFALRAPKGVSTEDLARAFALTAEPLATDPVLASAQRAVPDALRAVELLSEATDAGAGGTTTGTAPRRRSGRLGTLGAKPGKGSGTSMTELLATAAGILDLGIGTQVLVIGGDGFDTHSDQATRHPALLADLAGGLTAFLDEVERQGRGDDVLVITTSEFGRRVAENGSGTDHGAGGVQLVAGRGVHGRQVVGQADLAHLVDGDLPLGVDTRSLYAVALDWLGGPTDEVLGGTYDRYGLLT